MKGILTEQITGCVAHAVAVVRLRQACGRSQGGSCRTGTKSNPMGVWIGSRKGLVLNGLKAHTQVRVRNRIKS